MTVMTGKNEGGWLLVEVVVSVKVSPSGRLGSRTMAGPHERSRSQAMGSVASTTAQFQLRRRPYAPLASCSSVSAITAPAVVETASSTRVSCIVIRARISRQPAGLPCFYEVPEPAGTPHGCSGAHESIDRAPWFPLH